MDEEFNYYDCKSDGGGWSFYATIIFFVSCILLVNQNKNFYVELGGILVIIGCSYLIGKIDKWDKQCGYRRKLQEYKEAYGEL